MFTDQITVVNFIATLQIVSDLGYSATNTARSALSAITVLPCGNTAGNLRAMKRCLRGVYNEKPSLPRYSCTWDVNMLLNFLRTLRVNDLDLRLISLKLATMFAVFTSQRLATITCLKKANVSISGNKCSIYIDTPQKTSKPGKHFPALEFSRFTSNLDLCIIEHLERYLVMTESLRTGNKQILISHVRPHGDISVDTTRRWVREVMRLAGVDVQTFGAHSVRGAAASALINQGASIVDIMSKVGWSSETTVARHYNIPIISNVSFSDSIQAL